MAFAGKYRNPLYTYRHSIAESGVAALSLVNASAAAGFPLDRLTDRQIGLVTRIDPSGAGPELRVAHAQARRPIRLSRILIPAGHSFGTHNTRLHVQLDINDPPWISGFGKAFRPDATAVDDLMPVNELLVDIPLRGGQLDLVANPWRFWRITWEGADVNDLLDFAELFAGETVQPATGIVRAWDDQVAPGVTRLNTRAGRTFTIQSSDRPRRAWTIQHRGVALSDAELYEDMLRSIGYGVHPFYFEGPASATVERIPMDTTTGWVHDAPATLGTATGHGEGSQTALEFVVPDASSGFFGMRYAVAPVEDWRNMLLQFDFYAVSLDPVADSDLRVTIRSTGETFVHKSHFFFGDGVVEQGLVGEWYRFQIDLDRAPDFVADGELPADLGAVDEIQFQIFVNSASGAKTHRFDRVTLIDKDAQPHYVELVDYDRRQSSDAPRAELRYDYRLELVEKLP